MAQATVYEMVSTGNYDEKNLTKFYAKHLKLNNNNAVIAQAMVNIYKHSFIIRERKAVN